MTTPFRVNSNPLPSLAFTLFVMMPALALWGCAPEKPATDPLPVVTYKTRLIDSGCDWTNIITVTKDALTEEKAAAILSGMNLAISQKTLTSKQILVSLIAQTQQDWLTDPTAKMIKAHDVAFISRCSKPK